MCIKNVNNFQTAKVWPRGVLSICFIFSQFQSGVPYKNDALIKEVCTCNFIYIASSIGINKDITRENHCLPYGCLKNENNIGWQNILKEAVFQ